MKLEYDEKEGYYISIEKPLKVLLKLFHKIIITQKLNEKFDQEEVKKIQVIQRKIILQLNQDSFKFILETDKYEHSPMQQYISSILDTTQMIIEKLKSNNLY